MDRNDARKIAETITNEQLKNMLEMAKQKITDWTKVSHSNLGMTKGTAWNILAKDFDVTKTYHILAKTNMIREFGEFLPDELKIQKKKRQSPLPVHQEPQFL